MVNCTIIGCVLFCIDLVKYCAVFQLINSKSCSSIMFCVCVKKNFQILKHRQNEIPTALKKKSIVMCKDYLNRKRDIVLRNKFLFHLSRITGYTTRTSINRGFTIIWMYKLRCFTLLASIVGKLL